VTGKPYPRHATLAGTSLAAWHRTTNLCPCSPVAHRDVAEPAQLIWVHRDVPDPSVVHPAQPATSPRTPGWPTSLRR